MDQYANLTTGELYRACLPLIAKMSSLEFAQFEQLEALKDVVDSMEDFLSSNPSEQDELEALRDMAQELIEKFSG